MIKAKSTMRTRGSVKKTESQCRTIRGPKLDSDCQSLHKNATLTVADVTSIMISGVFGTGLNWVVSPPYTFTTTSSSIQL